MNPTEYQTKILGFANTNLSAQQRLDNWSMGLMGESGEVIDLLKKLEYHGHPFDADAKNKLIKEMGDVCFYLAIYCHDIGVDFSVIANYRYPDGKAYTERLLTCPIDEISRELYGFVHRLNTKVQTIKKAGKGDDMTWAMACFMSSAKGIYGILTIIGIIHGIDIRQVLTENVVKLSARYPDGFKSKKSRERNNAE